MKKLTTKEITNVVAGAIDKDTPILAKKSTNEEPVMKGSSGRLSNNSISFSGNVN